MLTNHKEWREREKIDDIKFLRAPIPIRGFESFPDGNAEGIFFFYFYFFYLIYFEFIFVTLFFKINRN